MSCRRLRRELLDVVRFGGGLLRAGAHLDHLERCRACRQEVSFDRELVHAVRRSLQARVEGADPSPHAWSAVVREIGMQEGGLLGWFRARSTLVLGRLRTATAISAVALAVVVANGTQTTITQAPVSSETRGALGDWFERQPLLARGSIPGLARTRVYVAPPPSDPEQLLVQSALRIAPAGEPEEADDGSEESRTPAEVVFELGGGGASPVDNGADDPPGRAAATSRVRGSPGGVPR